MKLQEIKGNDVRVLELNGEQLIATHRGVLLQPKPGRPYKVGKYEFRAKQVRGISGDIVDDFVLFVSQ